MIDRQVAKDPAARFATAEGLVEALDAAQLISPEIPLVIRLLERALFAFDRVVLTVLVLFVGFYVTLGYGKATETFAFWVCVSVLWATVIARLTMVSSNLRLALQQGHSADDIIRGLGALEMEPAAAFSELLSDPRARRRLRWYIVMLVVMLAISIALIASAPPYWTSPANGKFMIDVDDKGTFLLGALLGGPSLAMLAKLSLGGIDRRALDVIWLSRPGRWFLRRLSARGIRRIPTSADCTLGARRPARYSSRRCRPSRPVAAR